jgi:hypothetical protein
MDLITTQPTITQYQPRQTRLSIPEAPTGHPPHHGQSSSVAQPFLGFNSLAGVSRTGLVNQERLASASRMPRQPLLSVRGRRARGNALPLPTLPSTQTPEAICSTNVGGEQMVHVTVKVYPPSV